MNPAGKLKTSDLLFLVIVLSMMACEPELRARVKGGTVPVFRFSGDDTMDHFFICPEGEEGKRNERNALWLIAPDSQHKKSWPIDITYGVVPEGFIQSIPKNDEPPPQLESDKKYTYHFVRGFGGGGGGFKIHEGRAIEW